MLVVGLNPDSTPGVTVPLAMRLEGVSALSIVKYAIALEHGVVDFISKLRPEFVVKGKEFEKAANPEAAIVESYGGKLIFSSGDVQFASMELLREEFEVTVPPPHLRSADGFAQRHGLAASGLRKLLKQVAGLRVAIIGDTIVDDYVICDPLGMSQEDPTIVVSPIETHSFIGGAGIVSAHAQSLGAEVSFFTVLGDDETANFARKTLEEMSVGVKAIVDETRPTTRKQRYRALEKTLLRVNHLRQHAIRKELIASMFKSVDAVIPYTDLLIFSDFNYGCLPQDLVDSICDRARSHNVMMVADSQASSQMSNIARFKGMALVTPTEHEARLAMRDTASGLPILAATLREQAEAENVLLKLGADGMMVHGRDNDEYMTDRIPALNPTPKDVAGAGDSVLTVSSMALRAGSDIWHASHLGAVAAAVQVSRIGNTPLQVGDLLFELNQLEDET